MSVVFCYSKRKHCGKSLHSLNLKAALDQGVRSSIPPALSSTKPKMFLVICRFVTVFLPTYLAPSRLLAKVSKIYYCHPLPNKILKSTKLLKLFFRKVNSQGNIIKFHYDSYANMRVISKIGNIINCETNWLP